MLTVIMSAIWRYEKEFALIFREYTTLICRDDKHVVKVREPGPPVASVDRGKSVLVAKGLTFEVADHDFCKISMTRSVTLKVNIPEDSFYQGKCLHRSQGELL